MHYPNKTTLIVALSALFCFSTLQAQAGPILITINNAEQTGSIGETLFFNGSVTNTSDVAVDYGGALLGIFSREPNDTAAYANLFYSSELLNFLSTDPFDPGETSGTIPLFRAQLAQSRSGSRGTAILNGALILADGDPFVPSNEIGRGAFRITAVPEPATVLLLGAGLATLGAAVRKKRRQ